MKDSHLNKDSDFKSGDAGSNKRIAKNTIYLYIRTFVMMLVSLYTSRIALQVLGEEDFGIVPVEAQASRKTSYCIWKRWSTRFCN